MLVTSKLDADFSRGRAGRKTSRSILKTHPLALSELLWTRIGGESMVGSYAWTSTSGKLTN